MVTELANKVAVITGASRGIGAGMAAYFAQQGLRLGLCARSEPADPSADCLCAAVDVTDTAAVKAFAKQVEKKFGPIDLWINNAGVLDPINTLHDSDLTLFSQLIDINIMGVVNGCQYYVRHRREQGGGGILINVSSGAGQNAYAGWGAYCASKAAVDRFSEVLQLEEAQHGMRVYSVAPGVVDTAMQAKIRSVSAEEFPKVDQFHELKKNDQFNTPDFVASELLAYAFDSDRQPDAVLVRVPNQWQTA